MRFRRIIVAVVAVLAPSGLCAQTVLGRLINEATGEAVDGAFVVLVDSAGGEHGGILTDDDGRYFARAPGPGTYRLKVERIGFATRYSDPLALGAGETVAHNMSLSFQAIELAAIRVEGEQRCDVRPGEGARTAEVWDEARKALRLAAWTEEQEAVRFRVVRYEREVDPASGRVITENRSGRSGYAFGSPFRSVPAEDLAEKGYIREEPDGGWTYLAPDAEVLLSDSFLDGHCFELRAGDDPDLIGLGFRPVQRGETRDIRGVMWLDRATAQLRRLEFDYMELPYPVEGGGFGGFIEFARVRGGPWIVREWRIRMPNNVTEHHEYVPSMGVDRTSYRVRSISEAGGEVHDVVDRQGRELDPEAAGGVLTGVVFDSTGIVAKAAVTVTLPGVGVDVRTDNTGRFRVSGLGGGRYGVVVTPRRWEYPWPPPERTQVEVPEDGVTAVRMTLPTGAELAAAWCGTLPDSLPAMVVGRVLSAANGAAIPRAQVILSWNRVDVDPNWSGWTTTAGGATARTDDGGWFRVCGVPVESEVRMVALRPEDDPRRVVQWLWDPTVMRPQGTVAAGLAADQRMLRQDLELH